MEGGRFYIRSLDRGLAVIRSFSAERPIQTISDVARTTNMPRATARRILLTLRELGYIEKDADDYRLTARVLELGYAYISGEPIVVAAEGAIQRLAAMVKESSSVGVLDGDEVVYVSRIQTKKIMSVNLSIGSRLPALWTSMGRALIANHDLESIRQRLGRARKIKFTEYTETRDERLLEILERVRDRGWALVEQELEYGLISIAVPVFGKDGDVKAAVNVSGQVRKNTRKDMETRVLPELKRAAEEIERLLQLGGIS